MRVECESTSIWAAGRAGKTALENLKGMGVRQFSERFRMSPETQMTAVALIAEECQELLEDLHDQAVTAQRRHEPAISSGLLQD